MFVIVVHISLLSFIVSVEFLYNGRPTSEIVFSPMVLQTHLYESKITVRR